MTVATQNWEQELTAYLSELTDVQRELLAVLDEKRRMMAALDTEGLERLQPRANELSERLARCQSRRQEMLAASAQEGRPATSLRALASTLAPGSRGAVENQARDAAERVRLLRHQSLTNWVIAQRTLLHLAEMLEIIATGGRLQTTYAPSETAHARGMLVNQEA